jgi:hypothetical protein
MVPDGNSRAALRTCGRAICNVLESQMSHSSCEGFTENALPLNSVSLYEVRFTYIIGALHVPFGIAVLHRAERSGMIL